MKFMQISKQRSVLLAFASSLAGVVILDQVTKHLVIGHLLFFQSIPLIPNWLNLVYVHNTGVAFGFFDGPGTFAKTLFFSGITLVAVCVVIYFLYHAVQRGRYLQGFFLGMICGGALGNLLDRFRVGAVVDFIDVHYKQYHWPAFNVADAAISAGVILLILQMILQDGSKISPEFSEGDRDVSRSVSHR